MNKTASQGTYGTVAGIKTYTITIIKQKWIQAIKTGKSARHGFQNLNSQLEAK
jgi:DNA-directed RNA polymerase specialized sigma24 family protein